MKQTLTILLMAWCVTLQTVQAQSIRKDYREFTLTEQTAYRAALTAKFSDIVTIAQDHASHFNENIHTNGGGGNGSQFLSWHRFFILHYEKMLQSAPSASYLTVPYWDWTTDNSTASTTFWNNDFLKLTNLPIFNDPTRVTRNSSFSSFPTSAQTTNVNSILTATTFYQVGSTSDFSHRLESGPHNNIHTWIGGTMGGPNSPFDPVFFLHHGNVDRLWQEWEDKTSGIQSVFPSPIGTHTLIHYNTAHAGTPYPFNMVNNSFVDSRSVILPANAGGDGVKKTSVWFAKNHKVLLDGANGSPFICNDVTTPYLFRYTAAKTLSNPATNIVDGSIYIGDVQRNAADNVITDNKGGFAVNSGVTVTFKAGGEIIFFPGFEFSAGSNVTASIITAPNGKRDLFEDEVIAENEGLLNPEPVIKSFATIFPNPNNGNMQLYYFIPETSEGELVVYSIMGQKAFSTKLIGGYNQMAISNPDLINGVYLYQVICNNKVVAQNKLVIAKD